MNEQLYHPIKRPFIGKIGAPLPIQPSDRPKTKIKHAERKKETQEICRKQNTIN